MSWQKLMRFSSRFLSLFSPAGFSNFINRQFRLESFWLNFWSGLPTPQTKKKKTVSLAIKKLDTNTLLLHIFLRCIKVCYYLFCCFFFAFFIDQNSLFFNFEVLALAFCVIFYIRLIMILQNAMRWFVCGYNTLSFSFKTFFYILLTSRIIETGSSTRCTRENDANGKREMDVYVI